MEPVSTNVEPTKLSPDLGDTVSSQATVIDRLGKGFDISNRINELHLPPPLAYLAKRHIHSRADGNQVYVDLVVQELRNAQISGKTTHPDFRVLLESLPYGLTNMFEHVQSRVLQAGSEGIEYTKEILRSMILALHAPTLRELAVMADLPRHERSPGQIKAHVIRCGAFLTLRGNELDEDRTVEWIDVSARAYLEKNAREELGLHSKEIQHGIIALRCLGYVYEKTEELHQQNQGSLEGVDPVTPLPTKDGEYFTYPFYYWIEHAKEAPRDVIDEFNLEHLFWQTGSPLLECWWRFCSELHPLEGQRNVSPLHIATVTEYSALVDHLLQAEWVQDIHHNDSLGFQPLYYACLSGNFDIMQALHEAGADANTVSPGLVSPLRVVRRRWGSPRR